jgi:hypothetical protein
MDDPNEPLEPMLSCWTPRRPSAALERRLFPAASAALDRSQASPTFWLAWAAPALACTVLMTTLVLHSAGRVEAATVNGSEGTNTPLYAALRASAEQSAQNALPMTTFTWTNRAHAPSTNASSSGVN